MDAIPKNIEIAQELDVPPRTLEVFQVEASLFNGKALFQEEKQGKSCSQPW